MNCIETEAVCDMCREKGLTVVEPPLRLCDGCLERRIQCIKAVVICVSEDSMSKNAGAQKEVLKEKEEQSDPFYQLYRLFQMVCMLPRENDKASQTGCCL